MHTSAEKHDVYEALASIDKRLEQIEEILRLMLVNSVMNEAAKCIEKVSSPQNANASDKKEPSPLKSAQKELVGILGQFGQFSGYDYPSSIIKEKKK